MDNFMNQMPSAVPQPTGLVPAIDVYDSGESVIVETALPGVDPKEVELSIDHNILTISGKSERKTEVDEKDYYRKEIRSGSFMRQVALPSGVKEDSAKAAFKDGILKIELSKNAQPKPKKISIDVKI